MNVTKNNMFRLVTNSLRGCSEIVSMPDKRSVSLRKTDGGAYTMSWKKEPQDMVATLYRGEKGLELEVEVFELGRSAFKVKDWPSPWRLKKLGIIREEET